MSERARLGEGIDSAAFERECEKLRTLGERYVLRRFGGKMNHADAEDAVAEVLIRLHERASRGETPENLRAAFFTSVRNAAIDQLRARGARPTVALEIAEDTPSDGVAPFEYVESREEGAMLSEALTSMRRNYREAILLRFGVGLSVSEIAERQGISVEGAKKVVLRGTRQVKERLLDVTSASHCEEMQGVAKRQLFEKYAAEVATEEEVAQLEKHMEHCGRCKSLVLNLHHSLHDLATGALVSTAVSDQLTGNVGIADHLGSFVHGAGETSSAAVEKVRLGAFKATNVLQGSDAATGGVLAGTGQKIAAACATGATAATCVAVGVVPGVSVGIPSAADSEPEPIVKTEQELPSDTTLPAAPGVPDQTTADTPNVATAAPTPKEQINDAVGFERAAAPSSSTSGGGSSEFGGPSSAGSEWGLCRRRGFRLREMTSIKEAAAMTTRTIKPRSPAQLVAIAILFALGVALAFASDSARANYNVVECVPQQVGAPDAIATASGTPKIYTVNECTAGGRPGWGLGLEANGTTQHNEWSAWSFVAAPSTYFASAQASVHQDARYGYGGLYSGQGGTQGFGGEWNTPTWSNTSYFQVSLHCFGSPCTSPGGAGDFNVSGGFAFLTSFQANVADTAVPSISASGDVLDGGVARGRQDVQLVTADAGGGIRSVVVRVNGAVSQSADFCPPTYAGGFYTLLKPCASSVPVSLSLDTEKDAGWANGPNDLELCAYDVSGNASQCVRKTVEVDNSCPASGGQVATALNSGIDANGKLQARASTRSTETPVVRGALVNGAGQPVAGAAVCVYETVQLADGSRELAATATTQGNGRFATQLDAGPSRKVDVVYRSNNKVLADALQVDSTVVPTLRIGDKSLVNGETARFRGQLPGPNAEGRVVSLQARAGKKWRTFKQLRTNALGRFRGKYPFTQTSGRVRYTFRALVKRQGEYPYEPGSSKKRKLLVRG